MIYFDAFTRIGREPNRHPAAPAGLDSLMDELNHCSISGALVWTVHSLQFDAMWANRRLADELARHDHLFPIWNVFPHWTGEVPPPAELLEQMRSNHVRAVTICPKGNNWNPLSRTSHELFDALENERMLTIVSPQELTFEQVEELLARYPELPILMRNCPWSFQKLVLPLLRMFPNLHLGFDAFQINCGIEILVEQGLENQLLFCSSATDKSAGAARAYIDYADISEQAKRKIAGENLSRLTRLSLPREVVNAKEDELMRQARLGRPLDTWVLDFHAHTLPEGLSGGGKVHTMMRSGPLDILKLARRMGVDGIGFMNWCGILAGLTHDGNQHVLDTLKAMPSTCWGLVTIHPLLNSPQDMRRKFEHYFDTYSAMLGMKPYPSFGKDYDDPVYDPWWQLCHDRGLYALLHPNGGRLDLSEFDSLCSRFPNATFVAAHCGADYRRAQAAVDKARKYPNFYAEITYTSVCMGIIDYLAQGCGPDRVLYGTDLPMRDPRQQLGWVVYSRLELEQKKMILGQNAQQLLDRFRANKVKCSQDLVTT